MTGHPTFQGVAKCGGKGYSAQRVGLDTPGPFSMGYFSHKTPLRIDTYCNRQAPEAQKQAREWRNGMIRRTNHKPGDAIISGGKSYFIAKDGGYVPYDRPSLACRTTKKKGE